jgi:hypothetical protein
MFSKAFSIFLLLFIMNISLSAQTEQIDNSQFSQDGRYLAVSYEDLRVRVLDTTTNSFIVDVPAVLQSLPEVGESAEVLKFSPSNQYLFIGYLINGGGSFIRVVKLNDNTWFDYNISGEAKGVEFLANENQFVLTYGENIGDSSFVRYISIFEIFSERLAIIFEFPLDVFFNLGVPLATFTDLVIDSTKQKFVLNAIRSDYLGSILFTLDINTGQILQRFDFPKRISHMALNYRGDKLAFSDDDYVYILDVQTQQITTTFEQLGDFSRQLLWDRTDAMIVSRNLQGVNGWNINTGQQVIDSTLPIYSMVWGSNNQLIYHQLNLNLVDVQTYDTNGLVPTLTATPVTTQSVISTPSNTVTFTPTATDTATFTNTPTKTPTTIPPNTATSTFTPTLTPTSTPTATHTPTTSPTTSATCTFNVAASDTAGLISAMVSANALSSPSVICLGGGTYALSAVHNNDDGPGGLPTVTKNVTINGNGAIIERVSSAPSFRIFRVLNTARLALSNLTVRGGNSGTGVVTTA